MPSIVFIHGLFQNPDSWQKWQTLFAAKGHACTAPAYPFHDGRPAELRATINPQLGHLTFGQVVDHYRQTVAQLPEPPILIGHSMGGLVVQKLINFGLGRAGVAIDTAPPQGIFSVQWSFLKANLATVNPLAGDSVCLPSVSWFHYAFCNTMSLADTQHEYDRFVVPESRNIPRSSTGPEGHIDFTKPHAPFLFIAGGKDHIVPAELNKRNFAAYRDKHSRRDFKLFPNRTHYICGMTGWEEVAEFVADWIQAQPR